MANKPKNPREFPDLSEKLAAPTRKTAAQREKEARDAKAKRQAEENAAEIARIQAEFGGDSDDGGNGSGFPANIPQGPRGGGYGRGSGLSGPPSRHYTASTSMRKSGPGTLGPDPLPRKRNFETYNSAQGDRHGGTIQHHKAVSARNLRAFMDDDYEDDVLNKVQAKAEAKEEQRPTVLISNIPPKFAEKDIRDVLAQHLNIERVEIQAPSGPSGPPSSKTERKSLIAIVVLSIDTRSDTIDEVVSKLRNTYLGYGCFLSISKHLSTTAIDFSAPFSVGSSAGSNIKPFSARITEEHSNVAPKLNFAPNQELGGAPTAYQRKAPKSAEQVVVLPPTDLEELRLINKTVENVHRYGEKFEAALLAKEEVRKNIKWAWIWDSKSKGGVYYRWKLWEVMSESAKHKEEDEMRLFGPMAPWVGPNNAMLPVEFSADIDDLALDSDAHVPDSSEEEEYSSSSEDENPKKKDGDREYLTPQDKAELLFTLRELPKSIARLKKKHVNTITHFAIYNANKGYGVNEIVRILITNIERPFNVFKFRDIPPNEDIELSDWDDDDEDDTVMTLAEATMASQLVALYVVMDLILNSATGGSGAWNYRLYFENALRNRRIFKKLGRLALKYNLGRMRAERLKTQVMEFLNVLQKEAIYSESISNAFRAEYDNALTEAEKKEESQKQTEREASEPTKKTVNTSDAPNSKNGTPLVSEADIPIPTTETAMDIDKSEPVEQPKPSANNAAPVPLAPTQASPAVPKSNGPANAASPEKLQQPSATGPEEKPQQPLVAPRITFAAKPKPQQAAPKPKAINFFGDDSD